MEHLTRRMALILGASAVFTALLEECAPGNKLPSEILSLYPQLKDSEVLASGTFNTHRFTNQWYNLAKGLEFRPSGAQAAYNFFEDLAASGHRISYSLGGANVEFVFSNKPRNRRIVLILPENAPLPTWTGLAKGLPAATIGFPEIDAYITYIQTISPGRSVPSSGMFTTSVALNNNIFDVEAFQGSILVSPSRTGSQKLAQEISANSFGGAYAVKQGRSLVYPAYENWARTTTITDPETQISYPLYVLKPEEYQKIPLGGHVLK